MQSPIYYYALRTLIGILLIGLIAMDIHGQQSTVTDATKSAYDFDSLSGVMDADQVDYFSGNWSYTLPLGEAEGAGGLSLPLILRYSSAVTGTDRLIRLSDDPAATSTISQGTVTLNNATWVGLGWNLEFGAIRVTGGHNLTDLSSPVNHPFSFNLSLSLPDGSHRLVRQLDESRRASDTGASLPPTNVYYAENRRFMDIRWNYDRNDPLASTWTARTISGLIYTFGAVSMGENDYGMNLTVKGGAVQEGRFDEIQPELVYQWNLAEIRDQAGNTIRFRYASDGPVTTVRDRAKERAEATRSFRNLLGFADIDPRFPGGITIGQSRTNLTVVKTFNTAHLSEVVLAGADGEVARRIRTETSARPDIHIATHTPRNTNTPVKITYDNYFDTPAGETLPYGHYLAGDNRSYRMYDGIASAHRLDALTVTDGGGNQVARYAFQYEDDKNLQKRPPVAPGDNARTLLLESISVMGTGTAASDRLPPYRFTNTLADSYRMTKMVTPAGGEMKIGYEGIPVPDTTWTKHINFDEAFFDRSRRVRHRIWDADGSGGPVPPDTTAFAYVETAPVMDTVDSRRMRRITFPVVDEVLPGGHGKIRRDYVGEADLDALGLSATDRRHEAERDIRRGLLERTIHYDASGTVVQRQRTAWRVTAAGTWTGDWQWYYHRGIPQQAYWIRADTLTTTKDGVAATTVQTHNANNGLIASRTLKSGAHTLRVTETSYHADQVTSSAVAPAFGQPVLDTSLSQGERVHAAFLGSGDPEAASVEAFLNAGSSVESVGVYDFEGGLFPAADHDVLRIRGTIGTDQLQGTGNMYAAATVTVDWKDGGSSVAGSFMQSVPSGADLSPEEAPFDVLVPVPASADSARVNLELHAAVYKPQQAVYRKIRVYAKDLEVTGLSSGDPEDAYLLSAHVLDRPHVVTVKDGSGRRIKADRYRYGRFVTGSNALVLPDTTSAWLDGNGDGQVSSGEWIDRRVATAYDAYGNLTEAQDAHGTVTSTIRGYGKMRPVASFTGAAAPEAVAEVFDEHGSWDDLTAPDAGAWSKTGTGTPAPAGGVLSLDNAVARRNLPANASGVFEIDVKAGAEDEQTAIALAGGSGTGTERIKWVFDADGAFKALSGTTLAAAGASYAANQWYRVKIGWSGQTWWAHVDGVRYPASGTYEVASGGNINQVRLSNGSSPGSASFDNLRAWPHGVRPAAMTTFDPVALDAIAVTDANGHTVRYLRDGLRRVVQTIDGKGRLIAQRDHAFSRGGGSSAYSTGRPNRQTDIAYPSRDGHKDLSKDGHRTLVRGTGDRLKEGVSLATSGPYVVEAGETVTLKASARIILRPGFHAKAGSNFRAGIDPLAGGDEVTGTGDISYNQEKEGKQSVKLGAASVLETGRLSGHVTARADFHPGNAASGKTVILSFEDGDDYVRMVYDGGSVKLESSISGSTASTAMAPGYNRNWPWARVEMELVPSGKVNAWLYGHRDTRFKGAKGSVTVPSGWTPAFKAEGETGNGYLAGLYVGPAEVLSTSFDGLARRIQTRARAGENDVVTQTGYNRAGKPEKLLGPVHQAPSYTYGALTSAAAGSRITTTAYDDDPLLRVSRVIPPGHAAATAVDTRYGYWGAESGRGRSYMTVDDEKGINTATVYDAYGRMIHVIADSAGTDSNTGNNRTSFAYDALDRLVSTTMPGGGTSAYAYDTLGRMVSRKYPDADAATLYKYDDLGRVRFSQDARQSAAGKVTFTVYDAFGRVTRTGEADATFSGLDPESAYPFETDNTSWRSRMTYDGDGVAGDGVAGGPNYAQGRLIKAEENNDADAVAEVTHRYAYDHLGSVRVKQVEIEGLTGAKTLEYVHDLAGRITRIIYPDGAQARYAYDGAGRLTRVWDAQGKTLAAYTHTAAGNVKTHNVGHDVADGAGDAIASGTYAYNPREWVTGIDYPGRFTLSQQYDAAGNVTAQNYRRAAADSLKAATYTYDDLHRLTGFSLGGASRRSYRYDRSGNITRVVTGGSTLSYNYSAASTPNRLDSTTGTGGMTFAYNRNGWMTAMGDASLTYDYRGLATGHGNARYLMDPDQRRVKKTIGTAVTYYLRGADGSVLAEYTDQTQFARYVYAGSRRIARIAGGSASYYLADHLGSTRSLIDGEGAVTAAYDYWPYGGLLASSGAGATHFRFTGHERDPESGLDYMPARSYDYDIGRFLRPDPMQDEYPGISPYAYAANNPLKYVDPDGRIVFPAILGLLYTASEVASTGYDVYNLYETLQDPKSTKGDVGMAVVGLGLGTALPGPGSAYARGAKSLLKKAGDYVKKAFPGGKGNVKGLESPFKGNNSRITGNDLKSMRMEFNRMRPEFWKNEAKVNPRKYSQENLDRMSQGKAPIGSDGNPMELHHRIPLAEGGKNTFENLQPMTRTDHRMGGNYKANHPGLP
ncbi:MAG: hypothetical protein OXG98_08485 [Gemmatimonadetes bacterium]|nr:hypothetical protein [Gemmatimonadota bacterium]